MKTNLTKLLLVFAFGLLVQSISAQTEQKQDDSITSREVLANAFTKNRPVAPPQQRRPQSSSARKRTYRGKQTIVAKRTRRPTPPVNGQKRPTTPPKTPETEQFGATMWRLREEKKGDTGERLLKMGKSNNSGGSKLIAERVSLNTVFRRDDMVRLSFEVHRKGYLYIVDQELDTKGKSGDPYLIYPTLRTGNGDNRVEPGMIIEIPSQTDDPSYFEIVPSSEDYAGEMLTVIISPEPILGLKLSDDPLALSAQKFAEWQKQWEVDADILELEDGENLQWTEDEKKAGQGNSKLTQDDLPPQTLFEVKIPKGQTFMVSFPMKVSSVK